MLRIYFVIIFLVYFLLACAKEVKEEVSQASFPVLSYNSEISETLTLDKDDILIDSPVEIFFWTQHFQNPQNNLNNLKSIANFENKTKIVSGSRGPQNIVQPIYFNDTLCQVVGSGYLECMDTTSKNLKFRIKILNENIKKYEIMRGGIAYFDNSIIIVDAYGLVKSLSSLDGSEIWSTVIEFPILSPPLIYRNMIYFISADNRIFAIDFDTGVVEWTFQTISEVKKNLITASPVAYENLIIAPFSNGELVAFTYDNGQPVWSENVSRISLISNFDIKDISASPVISGNSIYSLSSNGKIVSLDVASGKRNWASDISGYRTPIISGNQIYVINENGKLICLDLNNGEVYWITDLNKYRSGKKAENLNLWLGPYMINSLLYNISYFGELKIVSPVSGDLLAEDKIGVKRIMVPPLILSNSIFIADENSNVFKFK